MSLITFESVAAPKLYVKIKGRRYLLNSQIENLTRLIRDLDKNHRRRNELGWQGTSCHYAVARGVIEITEDPQETRDAQGKVIARWSTQRCALIGTVDDLRRCLKELLDIQKRYPTAKQVTQLAV